MALLSHLDLVRMLERALRRSQLPVSFTGGFHPLPRLQLALALPLGAEADSDWLDLSFTEVVQPEQLMDRLRPAAGRVCAAGGPWGAGEVASPLANAAVSPLALVLGAQWC